MAWNKAKLPLSWNLISSREIRQEASKGTHVHTHQPVLSVVGKRSREEGQRGEHYFM